MRTIPGSAPRSVVMFAAALLLSAAPPHSRSGAADCDVGLITTVAGRIEQGYRGDGGPAAVASFFTPAGVAVGPDGSIYVADANDFRVRRIDPEGVITTFAGTGKCGRSKDGIPATEAMLMWPSGVAVGPDGCLYIADERDHKIRKVDHNGIITTVAGNGWHDEKSRGRFAGDRGPALEASLNFPRAVLVSPDGTIYIADTANQRVRKVNPAGIITTVAGNGLQDRSFDGGLAVETCLYRPRGLALGADGSLFIADEHVRKVAPDGVITTVAGGERSSHGGDEGAAREMRIAWPEGVAAGADGSVYIADGRTSRVYQVDPAGDITVAAGSGEPGYSGDGGLATAACLTPAGVALGPDGSLYILDRRSRRLRRVGLDGTITRVAGGTTGDGGLATEVTLREELAVAVGPDGSLYVRDRYEHRVFKVDPQGIVAVVAGNGSPEEYSGDGGPATEAGIGWGRPLAVGPDGSLYIHGENRVRKIDRAGIITTIAGGSQSEELGDGGPAIEARIEYTRALAVGEDGSVYIGGKNRVRKIDAAGIITTIVGDGTEGYSGDGGPAVKAGLDSPTALALGPDGSLYIAANRRVRRVDPAGIITTIAGTGRHFPRGDRGPATQAAVSATALAVAADGTIYIADRSGRVRKVGVDGIITTVVGTGHQGDSGDGGFAREAEFFCPWGLALGPDGSLYISDLRLRRIRKVQWLCDPAANRAVIDEQRAQAGDSPERWRTVARLCLLAQAWEEAMAAAQRLLALTPEDDEPARMRGEILVARAFAGKRDDHEARRRLIRILARADDTTVLREAADALVDLHLLRGERDQAIATLDDLRLRTQSRGLQRWVDRRLREIAGE